jgi:hypothetical protein
MGNENPLATVEAVPALTSEERVMWSCRVRLSNSWERETIKLYDGA